jgi:hypothetical protein
MTNGFAVVAVPQPIIPAPPVILRAAPKKAASGEISEILVAKPPRFAPTVASYEVYRTRDPIRAASGDFRKLSLVKVVQVTQASWIGPSDAQYSMIEDDSVSQNHEYFYMVVARARGPPSAAGTRSRASAGLAISLS